MRPHTGQKQKENWDPRSLRQQAFWELLYKHLHPAPVTGDQTCLDWAPENLTPRWYLGPSWPWWRNLDPVADPPKLITNQSHQGFVRCNMYHCMVQRLHSMGVSSTPPVCL
jgi:hypothetical protein